LATRKYFLQAFRSVPGCQTCMCRRGIRLKAQLTPPVNSTTHCSIFLLDFVNSCPNFHSIDLRPIKAANASTVRAPLTAHPLFNAELHCWCNPFYINQFHQSSSNHVLFCATANAPTVPHLLLLLLTISSAFSNGTMEVVIFPVLPIFFLPFFLPSFLPFFIFFSFFFLSRLRTVQLRSHSDNDNFSKSRASTSLIFLFFRLIKS